jgi:hypothetical protein
MLLPQRRTLPSLPKVPLPTAEVVRTQYGVSLPRVHPATENHQLGRTLVLWVSALARIFYFLTGLASPVLSVDPPLGGPSLTPWFSILPRSSFLGRTLLGLCCHSS